MLLSCRNLGVLSSQNMFDLMSPVRKVQKTFRLSMIFLSIYFTSLYDGVVLICGKQYHDRIISLIRMVWAHKTSTKQLKWTVKAMWVTRINFDSFYIFSIVLWNCSYSAVFFSSICTHVFKALMIMYKSMIIKYIFEKLHIWLSTLTTTRASKKVKQVI